MLRIPRPTPSHAECEAKPAQLVEFTCVCCGLRTHVRCKIIGETELVLARTGKGHWVDLSRSAEKGPLLLSRPEAGKKPRRETKEQGSEEEVPA